MKGDSLETFYCDNGNMICKVSQVTYRFSMRVDNFSHSYDEENKAKAVVASRLTKDTIESG